MTLEALATWENEAKKHATAAARRKLNASRQEFKGWLSKAMVSGARAAHKYTNSAGALPPPLTQVSTATQIFVTLAEFIQEIRPLLKGAVAPPLQQTELRVGQLLVSHHSSGRGLVDHHLLDERTQEVVICPLYTSDAADE